MQVHTCAFVHDVPHDHVRDDCVRFSLLTDMEAAQLVDPDELVMVIR